MITVEKIGGTSMSAFDEVLRNIMLRDPARVYGRVYVVSAYAGVTNQLLEHKKTGEPGVYARFTSGGDYGAALDAVTAKLKAINEGFAPIGLPLGVANSFIEQRMAALKAYLHSMRHVLASGYLKRENVLLAAREMLAAIGEAHSAFNSVEILRAKGVSAIFMDLTGFDDDDPLTIDERIHQAFRTVDPSKQVVVVTGYTKGVEGIMREFDRGYSEVTFSKAAVEIRAGEAIIHKEWAAPTTTWPTSWPTWGWRRSIPRPPSRWSSRPSPSGSRTPSSPTTPARSSPRTSWARRRASR